MSQSPEEFKSIETEAKPTSPAENFDQSMIVIGQKSAESYRNSPNRLAFGEITEADVEANETSAIASAAFEIVKNVLEKAQIDQKQRFMIENILAEAVSSYAVDLVEKNRKPSQNYEHLTSMFK